MAQGGRLSEFMGGQCVGAYLGSVCVYVCVNQDEHRRLGREQRPIGAPMTFSSHGNTLTPAVHRLHNLHTNASRLGHIKESGTTMTAHGKLTTFCFPRPSSVIHIKL